MYSLAYARKNILIRNPTLTQRKGNFKTDLSIILKPHFTKRQNFAKFYTEYILCENIRPK